MTAESDPLLAAAALLATQPEQGWRRLQDTHIADSSGHCRACMHAASGAAPKWPCRLAAVAEYAAVLSAARRAP